MKIFANQSSDFMHIHDPLRARQLQAGKEAVDATEKSGRTETEWKVCYRRLWVFASTVQDRFKKNTETRGFNKNYESFYKSKVEYK